MITLQNIKQLFFLAVFSISVFLVSCAGPRKSVSNTDKSQKEVKSEKEEIKLKNTFMNANRFKIKEDFGTALVYFERCIKLDPNHSASLFEIAQLKEMQRLSAEALSYAKRAVDSSPDNRWYLAYYAYLLDRENKNKEAIEIYEKLVENHPFQLEYYYELANNYLLTDEYTKAIATYNQIEEKIGITEQISEQKHKLYLSLGKEDKAIQEIENLIAYYPNNANYYGQLANLYKQLGQKEKAIETYEKLQAFDPENPLVKLSLYEYYLDGGENDKAYAALREAFGHPDLSIDTKIEVLLSYYQSSAKDEKLKNLIYDLCDSVVATHPADPKGYAVSGDFFNRDNKLKEAREMFRKSVELDPSRFMVWNELLFINAQLSDFEALIAESEKAMELFPSQPSVYLYQGVGHLQLKNYSDAVLAFEQGKGLVVQNKPLKVQFLANLGDTYYQLEKPQQAYLNYDQALELDPNNLYVLNNYAYFLSLDNQNLVKARQMAEKCVKQNPNSASYLDTYAWVLYQLKSYDLALVNIEKAYNNGGNTSAEVVEHFGDILYQSGQKEQAVEKWKEAQQLESNPRLEQKINSQKL